MAAEQVRVENSIEHSANISTWRSILPRQHAVVDELRFRRKVRLRVVIGAMHEVVVHEQSAQFYANEFLGEREVAEMRDDLIAVAHAVRPGRQRNGELIISSS